MSELNTGMPGPALLTDMATGALARLLTSLAREGKRDNAEWNAVQAELASRRLSSAVDSPAPSLSLRAKVIQLLAETPGSTPTALAGALDRSTAVVSRVLAVLISEDLVTYDKNPDDGRIRHYSLNLSGGLSTEQAGSESVPEPTIDEEERQYLALAISGAVRARRREHGLGYAIDRLRRSLARAEEIQAEDLALLARRELITSLRQDHQESAAADLVSDLQQIEMGSKAIAPTLYLPAIGSLYYELGRGKSESLQMRLRHLATATTAFSRCGQLPSAHDWLPREGWALLSAAEIWRSETAFGHAHALAAQAASVFQTFDDTYGAAEAARVQGFSLRLQGDFPAAIDVLNHAKTLAAGAVSDRCKADVLLQLGDAYRCVGDYTQAWEHLDESAGIAKRLGRHSAHGFSLSAQSAILFEQGELDQALTLALEADSLIVSVPAGEALNLRRRAVIARELASNGDRRLLEEARELFMRSLSCYEELGSPAGVAACLMGIGKLPGSVESDTAVDKLVTVASSSRGRLLLPIDPWVPSLLSQWATASDNGDVARVADWTYRSDSVRPASSPSEMAGEPRKLSLLAA